VLLGDEDGDGDDRGESGRRRDCIVYYSVYLHYIAWNQNGSMGNVPMPYRSRKGRESLIRTVAPREDQRWGRSREPSEWHLRPGVGSSR